MPIAVFSRIVSDAGLRMIIALQQMSKPSVLPLV